MASCTAKNIAPLRVQVARVRASVRPQACARAARPAWVLVTLVTGFGCILALGWELGEWYTFIRHGTELDTAYEDTLGDMALGTLGSLVAGFLVLRLGRPRT